MMVLLFLAVSMFDLVGLGLIVPYIAVLVESGSAPEISFVKFLAILNWNFEREILLYWMSGMLFTIFLMKVILGYENLGSKRYLIKCRKHFFLIEMA